jgi:hypothetical protein
MLIVMSSAGISASTPRITTGTPTITHRAVPGDRPGHERRTHHAVGRQDLEAVAREVGAVVDEGHVDARRQGECQRGLDDGVRRGQDVGALLLLDHQRDARAAVGVRQEAAILAAHLDAGDVGDAQRSAPGQEAQHRLAHLLRAREPAPEHDLASVGLGLEHASRARDVAALDRADHVEQRDAVLERQRRVEQDADLGVVQPDQAHLSDVREASHGALDAARGDGELVEGAGERDLHDGELPRVEAGEDRVVLHLGREVADAVDGLAQVLLGVVDLFRGQVLVELDRRDREVVVDLGVVGVDSVDLVDRLLERQRDFRLDVPGRSTGELRADQQTRHGDAGEALACRAAHRDEAGDHHHGDRHVHQQMTLDEEADQPLH